MTARAQEKVYVMTDRDLFLTGDTVRMRAWIYDDKSQKPQSISKYVYVELRDAADNLKARVKLRNRDGVVKGYMALPPTLTSGDYTLAAYTYYMTGTTEDLFFKKLLHIMNPKDVARGLLPANLQGERPVRGKDIDIRQLVPDSANIAISITSDRLCLSDTTSSIEWAMDHSPRLSMPSTKPYEIGQTISGTVYGNISTKKPQQGVRVSMLAPRRGITNAYVTGVDGRFLFDGFDMPDSTLVLISAKKGKRTKMENIRIDADSLPETVTHLPAMRGYFKRTNEVPQDMKIVASTVDVANTQMLAEITVRGQRRQKVTETYQSFASRTFIADELMEKGIFDLEMVLMRIPGVQKRNGTLCYRGKPLRFFIDSLEEGADDEDSDMPSAGSMFALSYPMDAIERIDFLRPEDAAFLPGTAGMTARAAVCLTLKEGSKRSNARSSVKIIVPSGYQRYKPFQKVPANEAWPVIYWNGNMTVKSSASLMHKVLSIIGERRKQGDRDSYTVHIDGFTKEGEPLHVEKTIYD